MTFFIAVASAKRCISFLRGSSATLGCPSARHCSSGAAGGAQQSGRLASAWVVCQGNIHSGSTFQAQVSPLAAGQLLVLVTKPILVLEPWCYPRNNEKLG